VLTLVLVGALILLFGSFLGGDEPFGGGQRVGVQSGGDQAGVQGAGPGGPAMVGVLGLVEEGVGVQGVEFVPGKLVAGGDSQRCVGGVAALIDQVLASGGLSGADAGAGGQGGAVGGYQAAGGGDGDRFGGVAFGGGQVPGHSGMLGLVGQGVGELGEEVAVPEHRGRRRQVLTGRRCVPGGQGEPAQHPLTLGRVLVPAILPADGGVAAGQRLGGAGAAGAGQPLRPPGPGNRIKVITVWVVGEVDLVGGDELPLGLHHVPGQAG
jgi:hypothetical protein